MSTIETRTSYSYSLLVISSFVPFGVFIDELFRGGHGRTGTIVSILIGILFNLNSR